MSTQGYRLPQIGRVRYIPSTVDSGNQYLNVCFRGFGRYACGALDGLDLPLKAEVQTAYV